MITYKIASNTSDNKCIADLAKTIWTEHYTSIIGSDQVHYMLDKFQSETAIASQIKDGAQYYILFNNDRPAGYLSYIKKADDLFLSKIYVLSTQRGKGIGKAGIDFLEQQAIKLQCSSISLTVNKYNSNSIAAYEKLGFKKTKELIMDIGGGFIMDDYAMKKVLTKSF